MYHQNNQFYLQLVDLALSLKSKVIFRCTVRLTQGVFSNRSKVSVIFVTFYVSEWGLLIFLWTNCLNKCMDSSPCSFTSGSRPTLVLHVSVNIFSTSVQETIMNIISGLFSCYISPNLLSREWLHLFSHSYLFSEFHDLTHPLMAPPNCS